MKKFVLKPKKKASPLPKDPPKPKCHFCKGKVGEDVYCHGCYSYVCDKCDKSTAWGGASGHHEVDLHLEEECPWKTSEDS